jgi:murein DD-endopeptidase MepM/ murein hydrolase activator NlpD
MCVSLNASNDFVFCPPDTIPPDLEILADYSEEEEGIFEDESDILSSSYAYEHACGHIYPIWDTLKINPYGINAREFKDTTVLKLIHDYSCDYAHPVKGHLTSDFGFRRRGFHYGVDIKLQTGDTVVTAFEGIVRIAKYSKSYGFYVVVRHFNGLETLYAHLSKLLVSPGNHLQAGETLGLGGNTGRSTGAHLHFEVRYLGQQVNPNEIISFNEYVCINPELTITADRFAYLKSVDTYKANASKARYYKIRKGDTLGKIAARNRTTVSRLCKLNKISSKKVLKVGRTIRIA